jgi:hypothetical protein
LNARSAPSSAFIGLSLFCHFDEPFGLLRNHLVSDRERTDVFDMKANTVDTKPIPSPGSFDTLAEATEAIKTRTVPGLRLDRHYVVRHAGKSAGRRACKLKSNDATVNSQGTSRDEGALQNTYGASREDAAAKHCVSWLAAFGANLVMGVQ